VPGLRHRPWRGRRTWPGHGCGGPAGGNRQVGQQRPQLAHRLRRVCLRDPLVQLGQVQPALAERVVQPAYHDLALGIAGPQVVRTDKVLTHAVDHTGGTHRPDQPANPTMRPPSQPDG